MDRSSKYLKLYLTITFGVSWTILICGVIFSKFLTPIIGELTLTHPLIILVLYTPSLAGLFTYYKMGGQSALKGIFLKLIPRKQDLFWFPLLFSISVCSAIFVHFGSVIFGVGVPEITYSIPEQIIKALANFINEFGLLGGAFGWVGFLLPCLQSKLKNNVYSGLLTGLIMGIWVFPGYGISSATAATSYLLYVSQLMAIMVFISYVFNATRGNLTFYLFTFWLVASGSCVQLYYFNQPVQILEITFFILVSSLIHLILKARKINYTLQSFPNFIFNDSSENNICKNRHFNLLDDEI